MTNNLLAPYTLSLLDSCEYHDVFSCSMSIDIQTLYDRGIKPYDIIKYNNTVRHNLTNLDLNIIDYLYEKLGILKQHHKIKIIEIRAKNNPVETCEIKNVFVKFTVTTNPVNLLGVYKNA